MTPSATNGSPCFKTVGEVAPVIFNAVAAKEGREKLNVRITANKIDKPRFFITTLLFEVFIYYNISSEKCILEIDKIF